MDTSVFQWTRLRPHGRDPKNHSFGPQEWNDTTFVNIHALAAKKMLCLCKSLQEEIFSFTFCKGNAAVFFLGPGHLQKVKKPISCIDQVRSTRQ